MPLQVRISAGRVDLRVSVGREDLRFRLAAQSPPLFVAERVGGTQAGAEVIAQEGEVAGVEAAVAVDDVVEGAAKNVVVELGVLGLAGSAEGASGVDDASQSGRRDAGATDDKPAGAEDRIGVKHPDTGGWIGVEGQVWCAPGIAHDEANAILEGGTRLDEAGTAARILPSVFKEEVAGVGVAGKRGAACSDDVGRDGGIFAARAVTRGGEENNAGNDEKRIEKSFANGAIAERRVELSRAETHGDFTAAIGSNELRGESGAGKQVGEAIVAGLDEEELGVGSHGVGHLQVERLFDFPAASPVRGRLRALREDDGQIWRGQAELRGVGGQVGSSGGIVECVYHRDGSGALADIGIFSGYVGVAAENFAVHEVVDATERGWRFKGKAGERRKFAGLDGGTEGCSIGRNKQADVRVNVDADVSRFGHAGPGDHDVPLENRRSLLG